MCLVSYRIPSGFTPVVTSHGNSKSNKPFFPTLPSTKKDIEAECSSHGPKYTMSIVSDKLGGVVDAKGPCDLPRNERQVTYVRSKLTSEANFDQVFAIMQSAKEEDSIGKFVRETRPSPEPAFILARDRQLDDLVRFCTVAEGFSVLTVDPTFNLGDFDVTPTTYRHGLLASIRSGNPPVFIGPTMIHYTKTFHTYLFFSSTLIGLRPVLQGLRAFGTDGEKALFDAFTHDFRYAIRLTCFIHFRQNIKRKLQEFNYPESEIKEILDDIFGCRQGSTLSEGLVDSSSEEEFDRKLALLEEKWRRIQEVHCLESGIHQWFVQYKAATMRSTMIKNVREEAGLGVPPDPFSTNASETVNSIIKAHTLYKSSQLMELVGKLKEVIDEQEREVERAVIGRGKYEFKEEYSNLKVSEVKWFRMSKEEREAHLRKVSREQLSSKNSPLSCPTPLPIDFETVAASVTIPLPVLRGIWQKAEGLLSLPENISLAPGHPAKARMVVSHSGKRPHLVVPAGKSGQFKCDVECLNFKSVGLCSHTVAVAHVNNSLQQLIAWFVKTKKPPNFTTVATHSMPAGRGRKGSQAPRKRSNKPLVTDRVDRLSSDDVATSVAAAHSSQAEPHFDYNFLAANYSPYSYMPYGCVTMGTTSMPHLSSPQTSQPPMAEAMLHFSSPPMAEAATPFNLWFISGNIAKCFGCGNKYVKPLVPPFDLCVQHREWRSYTPTAGAEQQSKFSPAYYHVNVMCICSKWPMFRQHNLVISSEVAARLTDVHKTYLISQGFFV